MAGTLNKAMIIGRLGRDPELRYTQGGTPVCNLSVATDEGYTDRNGQKIEKTEWHKITAWNKLAEVASNYLVKGRLVYVEGKLETQKWQDNQGNDRYTTQIKAHTIQFLSPGGGQGQQGQGPTETDPGPGQDPGPAFPGEAGGMDDAPF